MSSILMQALKPQKSKEILNLFAPLKETKNVLISAFLMILDAMNLTQDTIKITSDQMQSCINTQGALLKTLSEMHYIELPRSMLYNSDGSLNLNLNNTQLTLNQMKNEELSATQNVFNTRIGIKKQESQVNMAVLNSSTNQNQQAAQQGRGLLQLIATIGNHIANI